MEAPERKITSYRLSVEALRLLAFLSFKYGVTRVGMLEIMIREKAEKEGIK